MLSARCDAADGAQWTWGPVAWGGRGDAQGRFQTAHGVFAHEGRILVANRERVARDFDDSPCVEVLKASVNRREARYGHGVLHLGVGD